MRDRQPLPARIADAPEVFLGLELFYTAFLELTSCRPQGMTEGPISWMTIAEYADRKQLEGAQREDLFYFIPYLDAVYLEHKAKKLEAGSKK